MTSTITIIGLGAGDLEQLTVGVYKQLTSATDLYLRTKEHPVVKELEKEGMNYQSFDHIYEENQSFDVVYQSIVNQLFKAAEGKEIIYAVPGHPLVAERTVQLLLEQSQEQSVSVRIAGGQSFLDPMFSALKIDPIEGFQMVDATDFDEEHLELSQHMIICQVYDQFVASDVKLSLMERLPDDYEIVVVTAAGTSSEQIQQIALYELDRVTEINNLTSVYIPPVQDETILYKDFQMLRNVISILRGPNGCPWDRKQTHQSLKKYLVEETYEVLDAIDEENDDHLVEELGDVLLQIMLHAQIGEDEGYFTIYDVIHSITEKMIRRHPHVFGETNVDSSEEVVQKWEEIKKQEKQDGEQQKSLLDGIPSELPSLYRAFELQKKAAKVGFDWDEVEPMWDKLAEELQEFKQEIDKNEKDKLQAEFGDIIFALVNIARYYKVDPEEGLRSTNRKFYNRFQFIEKRVSERGLDIAKMSLDELDEIWNEAKLQ